ncbi:hypothetical protein T484DRAFT_3627432 [Baffinella frigidus]|nr:hypothetical protein T484DRAFT_3627432 [Cryptophyta sp. CCMP2293]
MIGIGSSSQEKKLSVHGTNTEDANLEILASFSSKKAVNGAAGIGLGCYNQTLKSGIIHERLGSYGRGSLHICNNNESSITDFTMNDVKLTITNEGNVGIGTTNPASQLHINAENNPTLLIEDGDGPNQARIVFKTSDTNWCLGQHGGNDGVFKICNSAILGDSKFSISKNTGYIGINNDNPAHQLDVSGTISINNDNTADFELLKFNTDRPWSFFNRGTDSASTLELMSSGSGKDFNISNKDGNAFATFHANNNSHVAITALSIGPDLNSPGDFKLDVVGDINTSTGYKIDGVALSTDNIAETTNKKNI